MIEELVKYVVTALVTEKESVHLTSTTEDDDIVIRVFVDKSDMGRVIGKNGKIANSIRTLVRSASSRMSKRYIIKIDTKEEE